MFMGTLIGPFFNLLIRISSSGFTELILTGERVKSGIKSGKIPMASASTSNTMKNPFIGKKKRLMLYMGQEVVIGMTVTILRGCINF